MIGCLRISIVENAILLFVFGFILLLKISIADNAILLFVFGFILLLKISIVEMQFYFCFLFENFNWVKISGENLKKI